MEFCSLILTAADNDGHPRPIAGGFERREKMATCPTPTEVSDARGGHENVALTALLQCTDANKLAANIGNECEQTLKISNTINMPTYATDVLPMLQHRPPPRGDRKGALRTLESLQPPQPRASPRLALLCKMHAPTQNMILGSMLLARNAT